MALEETGTTQTNADLYEQGRRFKVVWQTIADPDATQEQALATPNVFKFNRREGAFFRGHSGLTTPTAARTG